MIEQALLQQKILEKVYDNMSWLSKNDQETFAMVRRTGLGASDASVYLGVNLFKTLEELIDEKCSLIVTEEERAIGKKEAVRKGVDLEPLILSKFAEAMGIEIQKPSAMYRIIEHPQLTINFDGVIKIGEQLIPVEAKFCSRYADKYWNRSNCIDNLNEGLEYKTGGTSIEEHIREASELYGIPPYYYTQVQQQMLGLNSPFAYFSVLFEKGWDFGAYKIFQDKFTQDALIKDSAAVWETITHRRKNR